MAKYAKEYLVANRARITRQARDRMRRERAAGHPPRSNPTDAMWYGARHRAQKESRPFTISKEWVRQLVEKGRCEYCDRAISHNAGKMGSASPSLDKILPSDGYTQQNVVLACMNCNGRKQNHTPESLRALADQIDRAIARNRLALAG